MSSKNQHPIKTVNFVLARIDFQKQLVESTHWQCCMNCTHFSVNPNEFCNLHNATPPIYIAMHGCKEYLSDVPF